LGVGGPARSDSDGVAVPIRRHGGGRDRS
jgi:hypothetical protein